MLIKAMWKSKRNVCIAYTALPPSSPSIAAEETDRLDDLVTYQGLDSDKEHSVHGVDKASNGTSDTWDWRGKGWLVPRPKHTCYSRTCANVSKMIASGHWEVLGWGDNGAADDAWVVTYFAKTLFTPAGVDVYSRRREGLQEEILRGIKTALAEIEDSEFQGLAKSLFEIATDS